MKLLITIAIFTTLCFSQVFGQSRDLKCLWGETPFTLLISSGELSVKLNDGEVVDLENVTFFKLRNKFKFTLKINGASFSADVIPIYLAEEEDKLLAAKIEQSMTEQVRPQFAAIAKLTREETNSSLTSFCTEVNPF